MVKTEEEQKERCGWCLGHPLYINYHDEEWGVPLHDDRRLFEMLTLEGAQAGLNWLTILKKRNAYRQAFDGFDFNKIANYDDDKYRSLLQDQAIVRNRLKIQSSITNARAFIAVCEKWESFNAYIWHFVDGNPIINSYKSCDEIPATTALSDQISKDLRAKGFKFVGSTIVYAYMQAIGMVDDHKDSCWRKGKLLSSL